MATTIQIKTLPIETALEASDTDVLIIENDTDTCQITVSELRLLLMGYSSAAELIEAAKSEYSNRIKLVETLYPFKLTSATIPTTTPTATWFTTDMLTGYATNQSLVSLTFEKTDMYTYSVKVTESAVTTGYAMNSDEELHKWVALVLKFNKDCKYVAIDTDNCTGTYATTYSLDNTVSMYNYSAVNDLQYLTDADSNSIVLWLRDDDTEAQTYCFKDADGNLIYFNVTIEAVADSGESLLPSTYAIYSSADTSLTSTTTVTSSSTGKTFDIVYTSDIPYTAKTTDTTLSQSGNWVTLVIDPLEGYSYPTTLTIDGTAVTITDTSAEASEGNTEETVATVTTYSYYYDSTAENSTIYLKLMFEAGGSSTRTIVATWGDLYTDTINVSYTGFLVVNTTEETTDTGESTESDTTTGGETSSETSSETSGTTTPESESESSGTTTPESSESGETSTTPESSESSTTTPESSSEENSSSSTEEPAAENPAE